MDKQVLDRLLRPIQLGDWVVHIKGGYNTNVTFELGKVVAINNEGGKIQVDKRGSKSWIKHTNCIITINRSESQTETNTDDGLIKHSLYDLGLHNMK